MPLYHVHGRVTGSKYMGTYEAATPEEAEAMAYTAAGNCSLCHYCSVQLENPDVEVTDIEEVEPEPMKAGKKKRNGGRP